MSPLEAAAIPNSGIQLQGRRLWRLGRVCLHIISGFWLALRYRAWQDPHRPLIRRISRRWLQDLLGILCVEVRVTGEPFQGPALLVSNHVSWLDIPVIGAHREVHFLSKEEVRYWPLIGMLAVAAGTLFIKRGSGDSRAKCSEIAAHLEAGRPILVFPEGTSTDGTGVRRFFPRLFEAPIMAGVPVQAVAIRYLDRHGGTDPGLAFIGDDAFHHHLWQLLARESIRVELHFGHVLCTRDSDRAGLSQRARDQVACSLFRG